MNPYQLLKVDASAGGGVGRLFLDSNLIYCIDKCLFLQNGAADTIQLGATNYFGPGAYGATAITGPAYLQRYTQSSGEVARIDLGAATYKNTDGFLMTGGIVQGYRYFIRVLGGLVDVSNFGNVNYDSTATLLSVEGTASVKSTTFTAGEAYSTNTFVPTQAADVFSISSTNAGTDLKIGGGFYGAYAQGNYIRDANSGLASLDVSGARFDNFGQSATAGGYGAILLTSSNAFVHIAANRIGCSGPNTSYGVLLQGFESGNISSNTAVGCFYGFVDSRSTGAGALLLSGNATFATGGRSWNVGGAGTAIDVANSWDRPGQGALTSGWGTGATQTAASFDNLFRIAIGASPSSPAVYTFYWPKPTAPICAAVNESTGVNLVAVASPATNSAVVTVTGAFAAGNIVGVRCSQI
jgi:hypothetical protein